MIMELDEFLAKVGEFGPYQRRHYGFIMVAFVFTSFSTMGYIFFAAAPEHWCRIPKLPEMYNLSLEERKQIAIPRDTNGKYSRCTVYDLSAFSNYSITDFNVHGSGDSPEYHALWTPRISRNSTDLPTLKCDDWEFDSAFTSTIVTQWKLVCAYEWIATTTGACVGLGKMSGALVFGVLSDKMGRKRSLIIASSMAFVVGILGTFSPNVIVYSICVVVINAGTMGALQSAFILGLELVGVSWRVFAGSIANVYWCVGFLLLDGIAYFVRDWKALQLILFCPLGIFIGLCIWLTPESPRWLLRKKRTREAADILKAMARTNGVAYDDDTMKVHAFDEKGQADVTLLDLSKSDYMVVFTLVSCLMWFNTNVLFYGISYNTSNLSGDLYINVAISGAVELPAYLVTWFTLRSRLGRRWSVFSAFMIGVAALCISVAIPEGYGWLVTIFSMIGKFAVSSVFAMVFVYTPELYPTSYRNVGLGVSSTCSRVGQIVSPYVSLLGRVTAPFVPLVIFALTSFVAGVFTLLLPETKKVPLPDTLEDLRNFEDHLLPCVRGKRHKKDVIKNCQDSVELRTLLDVKPVVQDVRI